MADLADWGQPAMPSPAGGVAIVEDVWGKAFEALSERWPVVREPDGWADPDRLRQLAGGAAALVVRNRTAVGRELLEASRSLQVVARAGVGLDNIDLAAADDLGVVVVAARGANARSVAEMALALALAVARDLAGHDRRVRSGLWERSEGVELAGRTWGLVGLGATGLETARLAKAFGMRTAGFDPYLAPSARPEGLDERHGSLPELLGASDVVSLHVPLDRETAGMVGREFLAAMRPGAVLVNVGRGGLVDEVALLDALESGHLGGAGLDVRAEEPPQPGRLEAQERVVLTPHVAGLTAEAQERVCDMLARDIEAVLEGRPPANSVGRWSRSCRASADR